MSWNDERVEILKRMWLEGQSASQIAKELGGVTRNAVIGKVHRLGLSNRHLSEGEPTDAPIKPKPKAATKSKPVRKPEPKPAAAAEPQVATSRSKEIIPANRPLPPQPSNHEVDPAALAKFHEIQEKALRLSLMELTEKTCKWPIGDPATENFWFCGLPVLPGKPYCAACNGVAHQSTNVRRERRR